MGPAPAPPYGPAVSLSPRFPLRPLLLGHAAFTLLELLVSVTILALMFTMIAGLFEGFSRTTKDSTAHMDAYERARGLLALLSRDLGSAMVRTNLNRTLNFEVESDSDGITVNFCTVEERLRDLTNMSFVTHASYFWKGGPTYALYRAEQNSFSDNTDLLATAASSDNSSTNANKSRLTRMTLAYDLGSASWPGSPAMVSARSRGTNAPVIENLFDFRVVCISEANVRSTNAWTASALPKSLEIQLAVADPRLARSVAAGPSPSTDDRLRRFTVTIPMINRGVVDSDELQP